MTTTLHLPLTDIPDASVLAQAVLDAQGQMLLPAGTVLTRSLAGSLARRGVSALTIEVGDSAADLPAAATAEELQALHDARMRQLFRLTLRAGQINPLQHLVALHRRKDLS